MPVGDLHLWDLSLEPDTGVTYVARIGRGDVIALDRYGKVGVPVKTGRMPCATALDAVRRLLYVANYEDDTVTVIDLAQGAAIATVPVGPHPQAIAADPQANLIYAANMHGDSISVIDGAQKKVVATLKAGRHPYALTVDTQNGTVYAADFDADAVTAVDVRDLRENAMRPLRTYSRNVILVESVADGIAAVCVLRSVVMACSPRDVFWGGAARQWC
jgi:YVTN family beta-propeller protein